MKDNKKLRRAVEDKGGLVVTFKLQSLRHIHNAEGRAIIARIALNCYNPADLNDQIEPSLGDHLVNYERPEKDQVAEAIDEAVTNATEEALKYLTRHLREYLEGLSNQ